MFSPQQRALSTNDFARNLGVSVSSIYRIVQTLTEMQYLRKIARNTYEPGPAVVSLGYAFLASRDIIDIAAPHLNHLRDSTSVSCHMAIREGREAIYIYRALASQRLTVNVPAGTRLPCHSCAVGRVLLSAMKDEDLAALYLGVQLDALPGAGPRSLPQLRQQISEEKQRGFAISQSDFATAIAAPIRNNAGDLIAAINLSGPDTFIQSQPPGQEITGQLLDCAATISSELGYQG